MQTTATPAWLHRVCGPRPSCAGNQPPYRDIQPNHEPEAAFLSVAGLKIWVFVSKAWNPLLKAALSPWWSTTESPPRINFGMAEEVSRIWTIRQSWNVDVQTCCVPVGFSQHMQAMVKTPFIKLVTPKVETPYNPYPGRHLYDSAGAIGIVISLMLSGVIVIRLCFL